MTARWMGALKKKTHLQAKLTYSFFGGGFTVFLGKGRRFCQTSFFVELEVGGYILFFFLGGGKVKNLKRILTDPARSNVPSRPEPGGCEKNHH